MKRQISVMLLCLICYLVKCQNSYRILISDFEVIGDSLKIEDGKIISNSIKVNLVKNDSQKQIKLLERDNLAKILQDRSDADKSPNLYDANYITELGKFLQANYVIFGQLSKTSLHSGVLVSVRIVSVKTSEVEYANEISISNNSDYQKAVSLISESLMERIKYNNKTDKEKNKGLFIHELKEVINYYTTQNVGFLKIEPSKEYGSDLIPNFSGMNPTLEKFGVFREMVKYLKEDKKTSVEYSKIRILINEEGLIYENTYDTTFIKGELYAKKVSTFFSWLEFKTANIIYSYSTNNRLLKMNSLELKFNDSTNALLIFQFSIQLKSLVIKHNFL